MKRWYYNGNGVMRFRWHSVGKYLRKYVEHMSRYDIPASPDCTECQSWFCDQCPRLEPYADVVESAIRDIEAKEKK